MRTDNIVQEKSYAFAVKIVLLCKELQSQKEFIISKQVIRSGTAVGALVEEAIGAQTDKDFFHKLTIAYKEARETKYWLKLLVDTDYLSREKVAPYLLQIEELLRLIGSIQITLKKKLHTK